MSKFSVLLEYDGKLWPQDKYEFRWERWSVSLSIGGVYLTTEVDLDPNTKAQLVESVLAQRPAPTPSLSQIPIKLHREIFAIEKAIREGARRIDDLLRWSAHAFRLPPYELPKSPLNTTPCWPVVHWKFDDKDLVDIGQYISDKYKGNLAGINAITVPLPNAHEARFVELRPEQLIAFGEDYCAGEEVSLSSFTLFAVAWESYERQVFPSAAIILAASMETALKWQLMKHGDKIAKYILDNIQSPPLEKLISCAREHAGLDVPKRFQKWAGELNRYRNGSVHKPSISTVPSLQMARWFAVGEAILRAIRCLKVDNMTGAYIEVLPTVSGLPEGTRGGVLRREIDHGDQDTLHVIMDSGITGRFHQNAFREIDTDKEPIG